jgi:predicted short-subunit dehydrogenase-like oxidoreductase (DUF2520 family)
VRLAGRDDALDACRASEAALLCVPDDEIPAAARRAAKAVPPLRLVGHVSGAGTLEALDAARARGAEVFSLHPLQTFPEPVPDVVGVPCAIAGSGAEAEGFARDLALRLEMRPFSVPERARPAYHAAASMASNLMIALEESAAEILERTGIEDGRELLAPLVLRTAANWAERGGRALTGPIARGDERTIERHRAALGELDPELLDLYDALAARCRALAEESRELPA